MNHKDAPNTGGGLRPQDLAFILFRQKWKIILCTMLGIGAAAAVFVLLQPLPASEAKLLIKYVNDIKPPVNSMTDGTISRSPDLRGETIINSEIEILRNQDTIREAITAVGASKVLAGQSDTNAGAAMGVVMKNLAIGVGKNSSVINVSLQHRDPAVAQETLRAIINEYLRKHGVAHRPAGTLEVLQRQVDEIRERLTQTENALKEKKKQAEIISLEQAKIEITSELSGIRKAIYETEGMLAEKVAQYNEAVKRPADLAAATNSAAARGGTNAVVDAGALTNAIASSATNAIAASGTNAVAEAGTNSVAEAEAPAEAETISPTILASYERLNQQLAMLRSEEVRLLGIFRPGSRVITQHRALIEETERSIKDLGVDPAVLAAQQRQRTPVRATPVAGQAPANLVPVRPLIPLFDYAAAREQIAALNGKLTAQRLQLADVLKRAGRIDDLEIQISDLQRRKESDEKRLTYFTDQLDRAKVDQTMDTAKINNISVVQEPGFSGRDTKKFYQMLAMCVLGGLAAGLVLAFVTEMYLDRTFKRAKEVEAALKLPIFAAIPNFGTNGHSMLRLPAPSDGRALPEVTGFFDGEVQPWDENDPMLPYYEALRDRVVMSYAGDLHKPKIVGLTSCNKGAGVTRLATGLAAALSRDVERNVLYIGLERNKVAVTFFSKGRPNPGLPEETSKGADHALVRQNLTALATTGRSVNGASIVQSFSDLLPKLKASDYDYIIFDLPPIDQTSGSLRLASQVERTLLVIEAEETDKEKVERAQKLLASSRTNLVTVLNKTRSYGPKSLNQDI